MWACSAFSLLKKSLHFSYNQRCWAFCHVFAGHLLYLISFISIFFFWFWHIRSAHFLLYLYLSSFFWVPINGICIILVFISRTQWFLIYLSRVTLLNSLICSRSLCIDSLECFMDTIISFANRDIFISFFLIWMPFISFLFCLIGVAVLYWIRVVKTDVLPCTWSWQESFQSFTIKCVISCRLFF